MRLVFLPLVMILAGVALGCDGPKTSIEIVGAHATRMADQRVQVDVEIVGDEGLGHSVGVYCTHVTFEHDDQDHPVDDVCKKDLEDGDHETVTLASKWPIPPGSAITIRVRLQAVDVGRSLVAP